MDVAAGEPTESPLCQFGRIAPLRCRRSIATSEPESGTIRPERSVFGGRTSRPSPVPLEGPVDANLGLLPLELDAGWLAQLLTGRRATSRSSLAGWSRTQPRVGTFGPRNEMDTD